MEGLDKERWRRLFILQWMEWNLPEILEEEQKLLHWAAFPNRELSRGVLVGMYWEIHPTGWRVATYEG